MCAVTEFMVNCFCRLTMDVK